MNFMNRISDNPLDPICKHPGQISIQWQSPSVISVDSVSSIRRPFGYHCAYILIHYRVYVFDLFDFPSDVVEASTLI